MKDIKNWLDTNYPEDGRKILTDLYLPIKELEGDLKLEWEEFPKLERVWVHHELKLITNFDFKIAALTGQKAPKGLFLETESRVEVLKYTPCAERLEELYPDEDYNKTITELDLTNKGLKGSLDLSRFENLEELTMNLDCAWDRKNANSNYITGIDFDDKEKLKKLTLTNANNCGEWKLGLRLPQMINLEELNLQGDSNYPAQWTGSLKELEPLKKLTKLNISYCPNIKLGLETIEGLEEVEVEGTDYEKRLKSFGGDLKAWKVVVFPEKVSDQKNELIQKINEYLAKTHQKLKELNKKQLTDLELESKIELLETENRRLLK